MWNYHAVCVLRTYVLKEIEVAIEEACVNAIKHAHKSDETRPLRLQIKIRRAETETDGSSVDLVAELEMKTTAEEINNVMKSAAAGSLKGYLEYCDEPIVSSDVAGNPASSIFDAASTRVMDGNFVKVIAWYDNE
jgi:hypothetical protein